MSSRARSRGFTLVELLATLAIMSIALGLVVPGFHKMVLDARRAAVVNELLTAAQLARTRAMATSRYVTLCPTLDGTSCAPSADAWTTGWMIYDNADHEFSGVEPDSGETIVRYVPNLNPGVRVSSGGRRAFSFRPFQINSDNGTITVCDERAATSPAARRAIIVNTVGRPRITDRKPDGGPLDCS